MVWRFAQSFEQTQRLREDEIMVQGLPYPNGAALDWELDLRD